jgi:hypothetical protein
MENRKGVTTIFRGSDALGDARYDFTLGDDDSVTGTIVHVDHLEFNLDDPCVPVNFLPQELALTDLHLSLGDGTEVHFLVEDIKGGVQNGQRRPAKK